MKKNLMIQLFIGCLLIFLSILFFFEGETTAETVTIRVINQSRWAKNIERACHKWNTDHPEQTVELVQLVIGYPQLRNKLITSAGAELPPDLSLIDSVWLSEFVRTNHLAALDELDPKWYQEDYKRDFFPVFQKGESFQGHLWGVRTQTDMALLWYRRDWFNNEKIEPPETWSDLIAAGKHFQKAEVRKHYGNSSFPLALPLGQKAQETLIYQLLPLFWSNGGGVFDNNKIILDSGPNIEVLEFLKGLVHTHKIVSPEAISFQWNRAMKLLATGRAAMAFGGSYEKRMIQEISGWSDAEFRQHIGYTMIPAGPKGQMTTTAGGMCYVIYKNSKHKKMAMEILKLAVSPANMKTFLLKTYQHPPRISIAKGLVEDEHPFLTQTAKYLYNARTRPNFPEYAKLSDCLQEMIQETVRGEIQSDEAVKRASQKIHSLIKKSE